MWRTLLKVRVKTGCVWAVTNTHSLYDVICLHLSIQTAYSCPGLCELSSCPWVVCLIPVLGCVSLIPVLGCVICLPVHGLCESNSCPGLCELVLSLVV